MHPLSVLVYSLRKDSWRYRGDLAQHYDLEDNKCYIIQNGCLYWLGSCAQDENPEVVISYDMGTDTIHKIRVPDYDQPASKSLGIHNDCLVFLAVHENEKSFDIWTWNEGLWTKKFTTGPIPDIERPIGHWKNNKFMLECGDNRLVLCDIDTKEIKDLAFQRGTWCQGAFVYCESLLSIKDRNKCGYNEQAETNARQV